MEKTSSNADSWTPQDLLNQNFWKQAVDICIFTSTQSDVYWLMFTCLPSCCVSYRSRGSWVKLVVTVRFSSRREGGHSRITHCKGLGGHILIEVHLNCLLSFINPDTHLPPPRSRNTHLRCLPGKQVHEGNTGRPT